MLFNQVNFKPSDQSIKNSYPQSDIQNIHYNYNFSFVHDKHNFYIIHT